MKVTPGGKKCEFTAGGRVIRPGAVLLAFDGLVPVQAVAFGASERDGLPSLRQTVHETVLQTDGGAGF